MTTAREITRALRGDWHGAYGLTPGPGHSFKDRSMKIWDGPGGVRVASFAGDDWRACRDWLKDKGLLEDDGRREEVSPEERRRREEERRRQEAKREAEIRDKISYAKDVWRASKPAAETDVERYLASRAVTIPIPPSLRYHPSLKHTGSGLVFGTMVAAVQAPDRRITGVHRTFLQPRGRGKAQVSAEKMALGVLRGAAVRLGPAGPQLGLAEGIETALSAMQIFGGAVWAVLGTRFQWVELPEVSRHITIFPDHGEAGKRSTEQAVKRFIDQGREVTVRWPPKEFSDWNEALKASEAERVG